MMSTKRTLTQSSHDEQTTKDSGGELMQVIKNEEDNTKRAKLTSLSDTTLEDLPMELLECILVKAVAMEVKGMKPAKSKRNEKADLIIDRLSTVSLKWSNVLSTDFFRNELNRTMDGFAQDTLRWEIALHQPPIQSLIMKLSAMRDEVFMLFIQPGGGYLLNVYNRDNLSVPKDVIPITDFNMGEMVVCRVSNCVYLLNDDRIGLSVIRIWKDEHQFKVSVWMKHLRLPKPMALSDSTGLSVSPQGNLIIISRQYCPTPTVVGIYDANGVVQHKIRLSPDTFRFIHLSSVIQKADGNLVVTSCDNISETKLFEIDTSGRLLREYQSSIVGAGFECFEDIYGRILVDYDGSEIDLLDSELNLLDSRVPQLDDGQELYLWGLCYNSDRHEMVGYRHDFNIRACVLATIRFTEK